MGWQTLSIIIIIILTCWMGRDQGKLEEVFALLRRHPKQLQAHVCETMKPDSHALSRASSRSLTSS